MLNCYVIDDEPHAIKSLVAYIERIPALHLSGTSENPLEALSLFQQTNEYPDITFLDIEMPEISGLDMSTLLKDKTAIVFTTAHPNFAVEAFEMQISDYLLKPISFERFMKCISKISDRINEKTKDSQENFFYIQTETKGRLLKVVFDDILYIQSQKNYLSIALQNKKHLTYLTLTEIEEKLPSSFLRISKSFIINSNKISRVDGDEVFLEHGDAPLTIGTSFKDTFREFMKEHIVKTKRTNN